MTNFKVGLPPVIREGSTILIVGTLPGDNSIQLGQYYANISNHFWKILSAVYGETIENDYLRRLEFLHSKGLALWDVLKSAERPGSSDSGIENEVSNDFSALLTAFPGLRAIVFNGGEARRLFRRHVKKSRSDAASILLREVTLPSTSSTPGTHVLSFEDKVGRWKALRSL
jgi:hypoxanthine-DNA glycosylase